MLSLLWLFATQQSSPSGSSVRGISQAQTLEWLAISSCRGPLWLWDWTWFCHVASRFFTTEPTGKPLVTTKIIRMNLQPEDRVPIFPIDLWMSFFFFSPKFPQFIYLFQCVCVCVCACTCTFGHIQLFATPWTVAHQAPLSTEFPMQEYWNGLPFYTPWDLPHPGIEPMSPVSSALASGFFTTVLLFIFIGAIQCSFTMFVSFCCTYMHTYIHVESATCIHTAPRSWALCPTTALLWVTAEHRAERPVPHSSFPSCLSHTW